MRILTRYIIRQHIGPFVFGFSIITLVWILNLLFKELNRILSKGLPPLVVLEFFLLNLAWIIALTVPMATLISSLMAFGRMSSDNEITAIKATGVSLYRALFPTLIGALGLAAFLIWFNNAVLPDFNHRLANLLRDIARKKPTLNIEPGVYYDELNPYGLLVSTIVDSGGVSKVTDIIIRDSSNQNVVNTITAKRGIIRLNKAAGVLEIVLNEGELQQINMEKPEEFQSVVFPDSHIVRVDIAEHFLQRRDRSSRSDREKSSSQLRAEIENFEREIAKKQRAVNLLVAANVERYLGSAFGLPLPTLSDTLYADQLSGKNKRYLSRPGEIHASNGRNGSGRNLEPRFRRAQLITEQRGVLYDIQSNARQVNANRTRINKYLVEIYKKYSIPFACIVFVLIGAPLGIKARTGGLGVGSGVSLFFFLMYWASLIGGEDLADRGIMSPLLAMWLANIVVGIAGVYILYITIREKELPSIRNIPKFFITLFKKKR